MGILITLDDNMTIDVGSFAKNTPIGHTLAPSS
jgi:hypothetical protein